MKIEASLLSDPPAEVSGLNDKLAEVTTGFQSADIILSYIPIWPLLTNIFSAFFCLGCSAVFHLYYVKSKNWSDFMSRLDYGGISVLIFGSAMPIMVYSFACEGEFIQRWVWVGLDALLCILCFVTTLIKKFDSPKFRPIRASMFLLAGLAIIVTLIAICAFPNDDKVETKWWQYAIGGVSYIAGVSLYVARVPERCKPGKFDLCGASH